MSEAGKLLVVARTRIVEAGLGMVIDKDIDIPMRDGAQLKANVYHPIADGSYPVIMTLGPYGKDVPLKQFHPATWETLQDRYRPVLEASSCKYLVFETPDPEIWVRAGYTVVKVDSRGAGKSPGRLDVNSPAEFTDYFDAIEWVADQPWCSGRIGLLGISYYAAGQWMVAARRPRGLAAILPWQGTPDFYRDRTGHGGILCNGFAAGWFARSVLRNQFGNPDSPFTDINTGERNTGPTALSPKELAENRVDYMTGLRENRLLNGYYLDRSADLPRIEVPALVVANWGGVGLHLRGTVEGFQRISSQEKWLKLQSGSYFATFWMPEGIALQRRFFDRFLKGVDNGWEDQPKVEATIRGPSDVVERTAEGQEWPLESTHWWRLKLDARSGTLTDGLPGATSADFEALGKGLSFSTGPLKKGVELAGPMMVQLFVSSNTKDADLFITIRAYDPGGREVTFFTSNDPATPLTQGWLRVSHRKLDPVLSTEAQPRHVHDERQYLEPGAIYQADVEIWPASLSLPAGSTIELLVEGHDFEREGTEGPLKGSGLFLHTDAEDRPADVYGGRTTLYTGGEYPSYLLLPVVSDGPFPSLKPAAKGEGELV